MRDTAIEFLDMSGERPRKFFLPAKLWSIARRICDMNRVDIHGAGLHRSLRHSMIRLLRGDDRFADLVRFLESVETGTVTLRFVEESLYGDGGSAAPVVRASADPDRDEAFRLDKSRPSA